MSTGIRTGAIAVAMVALLMSLGACAQEGARSQMVGKARQRFAAADLNHDGFLSREETQKGTPRLATHFDEIDTDRDGQLSMAEIGAYLKQHRGSH